VGLLLLSGSLPTNSSNPTFSSIKPEERSTRKERGQQKSPKGRWVRALPT